MGVLSGAFKEDEMKYLEAAEKVKKALDELAKQPGVESVYIRLEHVVGLNDMKWEVHIDTRFHLRK